MNRPDAPWGSLRRVAVAGAVALALAGCGWAGGGARQPKAGEAAPWIRHIQRVDQALAAGDPSLAERAWHDALVAALGSWRWEGMVEIGDAYLRIGHATHGRQVAEDKARAAYRHALFRARSQGSLEGVLRAADAFRRLGDRDWVERSLAVAERLAGAGDTVARERVRTFRAQWASG